MKRNWAEKFDEEQDELQERIARNREITAKREAEEKAKKEGNHFEPLSYEKNLSFFDDERE